MATYVEKLVDDQFRNWIKSQLAILFTKEGLVDVVASKSSKFQRRVLKSIYDKHSVPAGTLCTLCKTPNVVRCPTRTICTGGRTNCSFHLAGEIPFRKCPNNLCDHIKYYIEMDHLDRNPSWGNTDATKWCTDEIEICKCFLPPSGYKSVTRFQSLDLNGILTVLISFYSAELYQLEILKKVGDAVTTIHHSTDLAISDNTVNNFVEVLVQLLTEVRSCIHDDKLLKAMEKIMEKIKKLQLDTLPIAITDINRIFDDGIKQLTTTMKEMIPVQISQEAIESDTKTSETYKPSIGPSIKEHREMHHDKGKGFVKTKTNETKHSQRINSETETDIDKQIYRKVLLETAKYKLPQDGYILLKDLKNVISNSSHQTFLGSIKARTDRESVSAEIGPTQIEKEQDVVDEQNSQDTTSDEKSYVHQTEDTEEYDVVDEQNLQDTPSDEKSYVHQTEDTEEYDVVDEQNLQDTPSDEKSYVNQTEDTEEYAWNKCSQTLDKKKASMLLNSAQLPDMKTLNKLCQEDAFGRKSDVAIAVCTKICASIKGFSPAITDVWASRKAIPLKKHEEFNIKFVVITEKLEQKSREDLEKRLQSHYDVLPLRDYDQFSSEEEYLMNKKDIELNDEARAKIRACIRQNAQELLQRHTYLSVISGCPFRSVRYGTSNHQIIDTPCIVLNVHYKGYIPIDEEPFRSEYDGVKVDVREDAFILYNQTAKERHADLKAGCLISGEEDNSGRPAGTLGGFAIHPEYGLCGLSCSHTLLSPSELNKISQRGQIDWSLPPLPMEQNRTQKNVYQPFKNDAYADKNKIGQLVKVIYRSGTADSQDMDAYGMDVALFQLNKRLPESSDFPVVKESEDSQENRKIQVQFGRGAVAGFAWHDETAFFSKYGAITGYTVGVPFDSGIPVSCKKTCTWTSKKSSNPVAEFEFKLHNQLCFRKNEEKKCHILPFDRPLESEKRFAYKGDSGSLMYHETADGNLVCVGIIEGGRRVQTTCFVTPILPVLKAIGVMDFKNFESECMEKNVKTLVTDMSQVKEDTACLKKGMADVLKKLDQMSNTSPAESDPDVSIPSTSI